MILKFFSSGFKIQDLRFKIPDLVQADFASIYPQILNLKFEILNLKSEIWNL